METTPHQLELELHLDLDKYEGPIDVLLELARAQKVDILEISILDLANQYLNFIETAKQLNLDLAADYLVMASYLAWLKSKYLLPEEEDEEPSAAEMAEALAYQLKRLEAMRQAANDLYERPQLDIDVFARGMAENISPKKHSVYQVSLYEVLSAYGSIQKRQTAHKPFHIKPLDLHRMEDALEHLRTMLPTMKHWTKLQNFLPPNLKKDDALKTRSGLAATFAASLELAKENRADLRQMDHFEDIHLKARQDR